MITWGKIETKAESVLIVGAGPSLGQVEQGAVLQAFERGVRVITVNAAALAVRGAHDWFTLDFDERNRKIAAQRWWKTRAIAAVPISFGPEASLSIHRCHPPTDVTYLHRLTGEGPLQAKYGLCNDPTAIHTGNSVWGALGLAWHMKPRRIGFLGLDATTEPGFPSSHSPRSLEHLPKLFDSAIPQLMAAAVDVRNGNRASRVTCFPRVEPAELLTWLAG